MNNEKSLDININIDVIACMVNIEEILARMRNNPTNIEFVDLCKICDHYFGNARQKSGSHRIYKTPWKGDPRINIQNLKGKAKAYLVKRVLLAVEMLEAKYVIKE